MDVWISKVICLALILFLTVLFGLLPIRLVAWLRRREEDDLVYHRRLNSGTTSRARNALSYLNCFSGGVFLATCFLHLMPEVIEKYNAVLTHFTKPMDFPLSELIMISGFFLIMLIEHGVMSLKGQGHHGHSHRAEQPHQGHHYHDNDDQDSNASMIRHKNPADYGTMNEEETREKTLVEEDIDIYPQSLAGSYASYYECDDQLPHHHHPGQTHEQTVQIHGIRSLVLLLALSLHTLFEGLALGLESTTSAVWTLFAALAIHKSIIAFTMGLQFSDTFQQTTRVLSYMLTFSIMSPVGIAIGTAITAVNHGSFAMDISSMVLQGVATGTFLYVTFFEVLQKELGVEEHSIKKVLAIICGFIIIALTNLLEG